MPEPLHQSYNYKAAIRLYSPERVSNTVRGDLSYEAAFLLFIQIIIPAMNTIKSPKGIIIDQTL